MGECNELEVDMIVLDTDPEMAAVEDDIRADLAKVGITLNTITLAREEYIEKERNGEFNMLFTRTWGAPYDPHSYLTSWEVPSHVEYSIIGGLEPPLTRDSLLDSIEDVQRETQPLTISNKWEKILDDIHQQALFVPLWGTRVPYVVSRRLSGFQPSPQTYSYPVEGVIVVQGSKTVTVAPGSGGAMFSSIGPIHPHQYFPNQLFSQSWVYEGLVSYGQDGEIGPALATSWVTTTTSSGGQRVTFTLREGVKFHDGTDFNCSVAKLNFDHVLSDTVRARHAWYGTARKLTSWTCDDDGKFILETDEPYYPLIQELTYIRPLTIASAAAFANGIDSHPEDENSCISGNFGSKWDHLEDTVTCAGLSGPYGTGPFKYVNQTTNDDGIDTEVVFARHDEYWGAVPDIEFLVIKHFESNEAVEEALLDGSLDMALGIGPLTSEQVQRLKFFNSSVVDVRHSDVFQHAILAINTNEEPTDDINVRKAIIHAINKNEFVESEFAGLEKPVFQLLPDSAPYCDVELNPKWSYDLAKAEFLNCPSDDDSSLSTGGIVGIAIAGVVILALIAFIARIIQAEKQGKPMFVPVETGEKA